MSELSVRESKLLRFICHRGSMLADVICTAHLAERLVFLITRPCLHITDPSTMIWYFCSKIRNTHLSLIWTGVIFGHKGLDSSGFLTKLSYAFTFSSRDSSTCMFSPLTPLPLHRRDHLLSHNSQLRDDLDLQSLWKLTWEGHFPKSTTVSVNSLWKHTLQHSCELL